MSGTVLTTIGAALAAGAVCLAVGWLYGLHRIRVEVQQHGEKLDRLQQAITDANARSRSLRMTGRQVEELGATVSELKKLAKDKERALTKFQDQVLDREATINSLRSRLYGARMSVSFLEEELESRQHQHSSAATNAITISVGSQLECALD